MVLDLTHQVHVRKQRATIRVLKGLVRVPGPPQLTARNSLDRGGGDGLRQLGNEVDRLALGLQVSAGLTDVNRALLGLVGRSVVAVGVVPDEDRQGRSLETLVVTLGGVVDELQVGLDSGRVAVEQRGAVRDLAVRGRVDEGLLPHRGEEQVADVAVIPTTDGGVTGRLGGVRQVVGRRALDDRLVGNHTEHEVVNVGATLGVSLQGHVRGEDVVVHHVGAVADLDEQVAGVVLEDVAGHARALRLPVQPDTQRALLNEVVPDHRVQGRVQLDTRDLVAVELVLGRDVVDVVVLDRGEHAPQVPHHGVLATVVNVVATHHVRADEVLRPPDVEGGVDGLELVLVAGLVQTLRGPVVPGGVLLAQRDRRALGVVDVAVLNDPALGPVRADQTRLVRRRRSPRGGRLGQLQATHGDVVDVVDRGVEDAAAHVDLHELLARVRAPEVRPDRRRLICHLSEPDVGSLVRLAHRLGHAGPAVVVLGAAFGGIHLLTAGDLVEALAVEVDLAQVLARSGSRGVDGPVALDLDREGVELAEQGVGNLGLPHRGVRAALLHPVSHLLGALDDGVLARSGLEGDPAVVTAAGARGLDPLAVDTLVNLDGVTRVGRSHGPVDRAERSLGRAVSGVGARRRDMENRGHRCLFRDECEDGRGVR